MSSDDTKLDYYEISKDIIHENSDSFIEELLDIESRLAEELESEDLYCGVYDLFCELFALNLQRGQKKETLFLVLNKIAEEVENEKTQTRH